MAQHSSRTPLRSAGAAILFAAAVAALLVARANQSNAVQGTQLVRGNKPGEWRYWGGDAWSSRYSALDQINASNFNSLQVAWQWNAGAFGSDEYYRTTPLYANGRLFTVATTRRVATAIDPENGETLWMWRLDEGIRWQKAPRQFAGRGLSYWTDGTEERVLVITPGYHLASLDAKTGVPDRRFGKNGVVDLMIRSRCFSIVRTLTPRRSKSTANESCSSAPPMSSTSAGRHAWSPDSSVGSSS